MAYSVSQAAQNKTAELESKVERLELKMNDEIAAINEWIKEKT
ncbi:hypothetical protein ACTL32_13450 [Planococcus sp. FY231025]